MNLHLMQGRLLPPVEDHIQEFPFKDWSNEFDYINKAGLCGVEWLVTKKYFLNNPVFVDSKKIQNFPISSVCLDVLVDERISEEDYS